MLFSCKEALDNTHWLIGYLIFYFGPIGVHALRVAAGTNLVARVFGIIFFFFSLSQALTFLPESR